MRHWIESRYAAGILDLLPPERRSEFRMKLAYERNSNLRCSITGPRMQQFLEERGLCRKTMLGSAVVMALRTRPMVDLMLAQLKTEPEKWFSPDFLAWQADILHITGKKEL